MDVYEKEITSFLEHYTELGKNDALRIHSIRQNLSFVQFQKGDTPIKQDKYHAFAYYIIQGGARSYYLKDGKEINSWFAFEKELVASFRNYLGKASAETCEFIEDSTCIKIYLPKLIQEAGTSLEAATFIRLLMEEYTSFLEERLYHLQSSEGVERYLSILENEPELLQRIPLTHLASYLGMSRETLSRLRAKIAL